MTTVDMLTVLHYGVLAVFVGGTAVLMLVATGMRLRVRRPLMAWQREHGVPLPVGPTLFLAVVGAGLAYAVWSGHTLPLSVLVGYPAGGLFWLVATWVAQSTLVTAYGVVPDLPHRHRAVAWSQIIDYVETTRDHRPHFVFLYQPRDAQAPRRLDLPVPTRRLDAFRDIVDAKLDARIAPRLSTATHPAPNRPDDSLNRQ
jgi:hypothetical protein